MDDIFRMPNPEDTVALNLRCLVFHAKYTGDNRVGLLNRFELEKLLLYRVKISHNLSLYTSLKWLNSFEEVYQRSDTYLFQNMYFTEVAFYRKFLLIYRKSEVRFCLTRLHLN